MTEVVGESVPYSITGSLPVVGDLQDDGFDIQVWHVIGEWCMYRFYSCYI